MRNNHLFRWFFIFFIISFLFSTCTDGKGFGGGRGGGFRGGGARGSGSFGGSKGTGTFGGSSNNRYGSYNSMNKPPSRSSFKSNAMSFGAGALGGVAAYSLMRSMSSSYHQRPGYYAPGYGVGETCINNEDLNGTKFGSFRCPLNGFPIEAKYCCGEYGKQYCCIRDREGTYRSRLSTSNFGWIFLIVIVCLIAIFLFVKHRRQRQKDVIMIPMEPPADEQHGTPFYHPPPPPMGYPPPPMGYQPPPMGYPPPPMGYPPPPGGNPYAVPPQTHEGNFNSYPQQFQMPYPPQQQQQQQQPPFNPYQVKEGGPPAYDDAVKNNSGVPPTKPTQMNV